MNEARYRYSELFKSFQGEGGPEMGAPYIWLRLWGCNFPCAGFGSERRVPDQVSPRDMTSLEEFPVLEKGCDSKYAWASEFKHLSRTATAQELASLIEEALKAPNNCEGRFEAATGMRFLGLTGGEPMLSQSAIIALVRALKARGNLPSRICETNGTRAVGEDLRQAFINQRDLQLFWSLSPKLRLSGEKWNDAIKPEVVADYKQLGDTGQLKFVVDGKDATWAEVETALAAFRAAKIDWPAYVMPVGSSREQQEELQERIALQAIERGYGFSARLQCLVFGKQVGT